MPGRMYASAFIAIPACRFPAMMSALVSSWCASEAAIKTMLSLVRTACTFFATSSAAVLT